MSRSNTSASGPGIVGSFQNASVNGRPISNAANNSKGKSSKKWYESNTTIIIAVVLIIMGGLAYFIFGNKKA